MSVMDLIESLRENGRKRLNSVVRSERKTIEPNLETLTRYFGKVVDNHFSDEIKQFINVEKVLDVITTTTQKVPVHLVVPEHAPIIIHFERMPDSPYWKRSPITGMSIKDAPLMEYGWYLINDISSKPVYSQVTYYLDAALAIAADVFARLRELDEQLEDDDDLRW